MSTAQTVTASSLSAHYNFASSSLAQVLQKKVEAVVSAGVSKAAAVLDHVRSNVPSDVIAPAGKIAFEAPGLAGQAVEAAAVPALLDHVLEQAEAARAAAPKGALMVRIGDNEIIPVHRHAALQAAERAGIPAGFAGSLFDGNDDDPVIQGRRDLLAVALNRLLSEQPGRRFLLRRTNGRLLGFLSDAFRRLDSAPILDAFAQEALALGLIPYEGTTSDTRWSIKALLPRVFEPYPGEVVVHGIGLGSSDYGDGVVGATLYDMRAACMNGMTREAVLRMVHLGGRISSDYAFSQRTYELDTRTAASAVRDVVRQEMAPAKIEARAAAIRAAHEAKVDPETVPYRLKKAGLTKGEVENAAKVFEVGGVETVPAGNTVWRLSNAVSWLTHSTENATRREELQAIAGELVAAVAPRVAAA